MALINPELIALARIKVDQAALPFPLCTYEFSNGFDAVEVKGAAPGAAPILSDANGAVIFLSEPNQVGNPASLPSTLPSQGGIKAVFNIVGISTPSDALPITTLVNSGDIRYQYGDYSLGATPYANVDPMKALRFLPTFNEGSPIYYVDVSVFRNPMTIYK